MSRFNESLICHRCLFLINDKLVYISILNALIIKVLSILVHVFSAHVNSHTSDFYVNICISASMIQIKLLMQEIILFVEFSIFIHYIISYCTDRECIYIDQSSNDRNPNSTEVDTQ